MSVLALYNRTCIFKKEIIPNVQISFLLTSFKIWETTDQKLNVWLLPTAVPHYMLVE